MKVAVKIIIPLILVFCHNTIAQTGLIDHWETVVYNNDEWKYQEGNSEPDGNCRELSFDDRTWDQGPGGIGYGDNDDNTVVERYVLHHFFIARHA
ncbi:hypothetical protein JW935_21340 [candidate division KSB1 bacterium]|nr:hypothetical protein [candidate division KSB1 bacterium]